MKKRLFSIMAIAAIAMTSCKKDEVSTDELGEATIKGNVYAQLDLTNDEDAGGLYTYGLNPEGVEGMVVKVEVNTMNWDQNPDYSYNYEMKTYTATTDANGDYELKIPATDDAYNVTLVFEDVYTTKSEYSASGTVLTENVKVSRGNKSVSIYNGAVLNYKDEANVSTINANAYEYGDVIMRGTVYANWNNGMTSTGFYEDATASPLVGKVLSFTYYDAPYGNGYSNIFTATIAADGTYTITIASEITGAGDVDVKIDSDSFIADQIIYNNAGTADSTASSIFSIGTYYEYNMFDGDIRVRDLYFDVVNL